MKNTTMNHSAAVLFTLMFSIVSGPGAYSQTAYNALAAGAARMSVPALPTPRAAGGPAGEEKSFISRDSERITRLSARALAAASPDQRLEMLKTLMNDSHPGLNDPHHTDRAQRELEQAILRVLASAPDAASFDYVYYRVDHSRLDCSVSWRKDVADLVKKHSGAALPGDWAGLDEYIGAVAKAGDSGRNLVKFLIDGKDVITAGKKALGDAQKSIHVEMYQLQADNIGEGFAKALSAKARAGLKVRLMIDERGSSAEHTPELTKMLDEMRAGGVDIIVKKPPFLGTHLDHRKIVVIDGKIGFTGGMNIGRSYQVDWHDQQTLIEGPAVAKLQEAFVERWKAAGGSLGAGEDLFPALGSYPDGYETRVVGHLGQSDQNLKAVYLRAIGTAQESISIANPYLTDEDVIDALRAAAGRGVKVRLVLPQDNDIAIVQHASRASYPRLVKAGVQVYEYKGRMAHEKVAVLDGRWSTFGSSNLDARSLWNNDELNLIISDFRIGRDIERRLFEADLPNCELMNDYSPDVLDHMAHQLSGQL